MHGDKKRGYFVVQYWGSKLAKIIWRQTAYKLPMLSRIIASSPLLSGSGYFFRDAIACQRGIPPVNTVVPRSNNRRVVCSQGDFTIKTAWGDLHLKESDPPTLHCAHNTFKNSHRSKITNRRERVTISLKQIVYFHKDSSYIANGF